MIRVAIGIRQATALVPDVRGSTATCRSSSFGILATMSAVWAVSTSNSSTSEASVRPSRSSTAR